MFCKILGSDWSRLPKSILWAENLRINKTKICQSRIKTNFASSFELQQITKDEVEVTLQSQFFKYFTPFFVESGFFPCFQ